MENSIKRSLNAEDLWEDYMNFLLWRCQLDQYTYYSMLFETLHDIEFFWSIDRDQNREGDGISLRHKYRMPKRFSEYEDWFENHYCSVLEMMIGLSIRVEGEIIGDPGDEHPEDFFMDMIKNLGLDVYIDQRRGYPDQAVRQIVGKWLDRKFDSKGHGSPFPIHRKNKDQRKVEIWDQMNAYVFENYYM